MQDNEKKPALRFKGFTDPWEQRKLGEIAVFSKGVGYSKNDLCEEGTPIILYGRLYTKYETCIFDVDTFVKEKAGGVYSKGGEVIVPASGETAEDISIASVVVKPGILLGGDLNIVSPTAEYDSAFLALTISSGATHKYLSSLAQGKSVVHLHNSDIQSVSAKFPTKREQEKIHLIFGKIDTLITLHQRKYEKLVNIKKSMLDKMFPKNGASVPEIRFKGFTDLWEQRKLGEIAVFSKGVGYSKNDLCEEGTPIILYGRLYTKYETCIFDVDTFVKEKAGGVYSKGGEVIVPASGETAEDISIASVVVKPGILLGGDLNIVSPTAEYDSAFLALTISSGATHKYLSSLAQGKSVVHLHNADIQSVSAKFPTKREQEKIHLLFGKIDTLITLHQRKLEKLQNIKKSCLEKMFV